MSHLLQMRGLKQKTFLMLTKWKVSHLLQMRGLKPSLPEISMDTPCVASFTDAWIETPVSPVFLHKEKSHLLQMRGLKPKKANVNLFPGWSHLLQMRGLKLKRVLKVESE